MTRVHQAISVSAGLKKKTVMQQWGDEKYPEAEASTGFPSTKESGQSSATKNAECY